MTMEASEDVTSEEDAASSGDEVVVREVPCGDIYLTEERYDRNLVDCLLDIEEDLRENETFVDVVTQASVESLSAWAMTVPNPRYVPHVPRKKHAKSADDSAVTYHPTLNTEARHNARVRRSYESDIRDSSQYRHCVEPTTYRYVPNNGKYRHTKVPPQNSSPSMNVRRMKCLDKYISPEQRVVQREVQKAMRKEQELQHELEKEKDENKRRNMLVQPEKEQQDNADNFHDSHVRPCSPVETQESTKPEIASDNIKSIERKVVQPKLHKPVELPPVDIPLVGKQISEKFMDKFSRRINALDEEIKRDVHVFRRNPEEMMRSKSEPSRIMSQHMLDLRDVPKESMSEMKPIITKHRRHEPIAENKVGQSYCSNVDFTQAADVNSSRDVSPRKGALFYKVGSRDSERQSDGTNSAPSSSDFYDREITPGSDNGGPVSHHTQPRRTMSFDQNMIQRAKLHRDFRLSSQAHSQYVKKVSSPKTSSRGTAIKTLKAKPRDKTVSEVKASTFNNPSAKHISNNFTAVPLGKTRQKDTEQEPYNQDLIPGVAGKRLQMSVVNHRLL